MYANSKKIIFSAMLLVSISLPLSGCGGDSGGSSATPDTTPPTVSSTNHANNATNVAVNSAVTATFSEAMSAATITTATYTLNNGVTGAVTYTGTTATFTPSTNLAYSTPYTATITTGAKDSAGNAMAANYTWSFTTGTAPDTTPPIVTSTSPANNATGIAVNAAITATFSETMTTSTVSTATFTLDNGVTGAVTYSGTTATFTPSTNLVYSTDYTATITTGVKDGAGNAMAANYTWSFTTGPAPSASTSEVTIGASASSGGTWSGANPDVFTPNAPGATVSVTDIETRLNAGTPVTITTSAAVSGDGDILVNAAVSWSANALTLTAERDIKINAVMTASGTSTLALNPSTAVLDGAVKMGFNPDGSFKGRVDFGTRSGAGFLTIGGYGYTVINDVTALQNMCPTSLCMYAIGSNIDAAITSGWNSGLGFAPVGTGPAASFAAFYGRFDGLGHTITGLTINRPAADYVGLFGFTNGAKIRNVGLVGGSVSGRDFVGGLVGQTWSSAGDIIINSYNTGIVSGSGAGGSGGVGGLVGYSYGAITNSYNTGTISGTIIVGGLVGKGGNISNSYNIGAVSGTSFVGGLSGEGGGISNSYNTGGVNGGVGSDTVGGLVGYQTGGAITNSYNSGGVSGSANVGGLSGWHYGGAITNSYNAGSVNGSTNVGGLVGNRWSGSGAITSSYWDSTQTPGNCAGSGSIAGCFGLTTPQMKQQSSFSAWDFANIWRIDEGVSYPTLLIFQAP